MIKKIALILILASIGLCYSPSITSLNTGQITPLLDARSDFPKYASSCRIAENVFVLTHGPITRRSGTKYIAEAKEPNAILIPFEFSTGDTYIIEAGNLYMRFYRNGAVILDGNDPYEITTTFDGNEIPYLRWTQSDNTMFIVDGTDEPQKLTRTGHTDWTITDANITTGPFLPANTEDINIVPSDTTGTITLMANSDIWDANHVGALWEISQPLSSVSYTGTLDANESSLQTAYFKGAYGFTTEGTWVGTVTLERSTNGGVTWSPALSPLTDTNFDNPTEEEEDGAVYRVTMSSYTSGSCSYTLTVSNQTQSGVVRITDYTDANEVEALVLSDLADTDPTKDWREGYWSDHRGWPKTVCFHQQRLVFGGSDNFPQTIWFGEANPDDYENFDDGTNDTDSFTIAIPGQNPIRWLVSQDYLLIGTSSSCGKYGEQGKAITPTSPNYQQQSGYGCADISAVLAGDTVLYAERGGTKVREFSYSLQYDKFLSNDLMLLSENIAESGIVDIDFQIKPYPVLWCTLSNGDIATLTYQREQEVVSWSLQKTDGDFESCAIIPTDSSEDEIWVKVHRDGGYYIEQFQPINWGTDVNDLWFVDSGLNYDDTATDEFGGLDHLEGETVSVYADTIVCENEVVSANSVTISNSSSIVLIGLPFTSKIETVPMAFDPQDKYYGKKIKTISFDFYETGHCKYGSGRNAELLDIDFYESSLSAVIDLYTSVDSLFNAKWPYASKQKQTVYMESSKPLPLTIRGITFNFAME